VLRRQGLEWLRVLPRPADKLRLSSLELFFLNVATTPVLDSRVIPFEQWIAENNLFLFLTDGKAAILTDVAYMFQVWPFLYIFLDLA
jgi:hypothetical protein